MSSKKPDKYLTEMKELPPSYVTKKEEQGKMKESDDAAKAPEKVVQEAAVVPEVKKQEVVESPETRVERKAPKVIESDPDEPKKERPYTLKDVILGMVNFISIVFFVIIIINFPKKSKELKNLKIKEIKNDIVASLGTSEIEAARPKAEEIGKLFLNETGIATFLSDIELQKTEGSAIAKVSFAGQKAVADKTGNYGVPIVIELTGSWEAIDTDLQKIESLPYLFRPVKVEIGYDPENPDVVVYKYGIFLYVKESLGKN